MKHTQTGPQAKQQGFTLVELGISMVLIASMILAGFYTIKRIRTDAAINAAIASANVSMNQANAAYAGMEKTTGAKVDILAAMNVWPKERFITTETKSGTAVIKTEVTSIKGHFSNSREMMFSDNPGTGFVYHFYNIPSEACLPLVKNLALHPNTMEIRVNTPTTPAPTALWGTLLGTVKNAYGALNMATAAQQCTTKGTMVHVGVQFDKS
jgi:type II secretory pathway pseudopilin PulG